MALVEVWPVMVVDHALWHLCVAEFTRWYDGDVLRSGCVVAVACVEATYPRLCHRE